MIMLWCALLLLGCTTSSFVEGLSQDPSLSINEKLEAYGAKELNVDDPERYYDGKSWLNRMGELVDSAEDYILISTFLGSDCDDLEPLYQKIADKAKSGVRVYFVIDGVSSYDMTDSRFYLKPIYFLKESGVHLLEYAPVSILRAVAPWSLVIRDHRKLFVVDGKIAVLGGMNVNFVSMGTQDLMKLQRDSMYVFHSPELASKLADEFVTVWNESSVEKIKRQDFASFTQTGDQYSLKGYLFNQGPGTDQHMSDLYGTLISSAKEEIIMLPYLPLLNKDMLASITSAIARGVKVRMLVPLDQRGYSESGTKYYFWRLVEAGVDIWYEPTSGERAQALLHEKTMVVDGRYTVIGSSNFNMRSMNLSHEIAMVIDDEGFARKTLDHVSDRMQGSFHLDLETAMKWKKEGSLINYLASYFGG